MGDTMKKKMNRQDLLKIMVDDLKEDRVVLENLKDHQLVEKYDQSKEDSMLHYPNGNDFM